MLFPANPPAEPSSYVNPRSRSEPTPFSKANEQDAKREQNGLRTKVIAPSTVRVVVTDDASGAPVRAFYVLVRRYDTSGGNLVAHMGEDVISADGTHNLRVAVDGQYSVELLARGFLEPEKVNFRWYAGMRNKTLAIRLQRGTGSIRGRVVDARSGAGVEGAVVRIERKRRTTALAASLLARSVGTTSSADGTFQLSGCIGKDQLGTVVRVTHPAYQVAIVIARDDEFLKIGLHAGARIYGVVNDDSGEPISEAKNQSDPRRGRSVCVF